MMSIGRAIVAGWRSAATAIRGSVSVHGVAEGSRLAVYNLAVEGAPEYFANGVLTHNCDALRYAVVALTPDLEENPWAALSGQRVGGVA